MVGLCGVASGPEDPLYSGPQNNMAVTNGALSVLIGSVTPIPGSVLFDEPYYLGVKVGARPVNYANGAGFPWAVLTDGLRWHVLWSNAPVANDRKEVFAGTQGGQCIAACNTVNRSNPNGQLLHWVINDEARRNEARFSALSNTDEDAGGKL